MSSQKTILITDRFSQDAEMYLKSQSELRVQKSQGPIPTADELKEVHGLVIRTRTPITAAFLEQAPDLELIVSTTSGFDHMDLAAIQEKKIAASFCPDSHTQSVAELTWALLLGCARRMRETQKHILAQNWDRSQISGLELAGQTIGIVGFGRIGRKVCQIAQVFGLEVIVHDPYISGDVFEQFSVKRVSLQELLMISDIVTLHVPLTAETKGMIHRGSFDCLSKPIILINTSRGKVIKEQDLVEALHQKKFFAVGLDVFEKEPVDIKGDLLKFPNVLGTPHVGATTDKAFNKVSFEGAGKIIAHFKGQQIKDLLPPQAEWYQSEQRFKS